MNNICKVLVATLALFVSAYASRAQSTPTFANVTVHDPSVVRDGSTYYVFGSHMASASTMDLMHWTQITTGPTYPNSLIRNQNPQTEFAEALAWAQTNTFWAPDAIKLGDGKYYFYYCCCQGSSPLSALGLAVADAVTGPYANVTIMLKSGMTGISPAGVTYNVNIHPNVVDPSVFFDPTGKLWMVYGSYSGGIFILALDSTPGSPTIGQPLPNQGGYGKKLIGGNSSRIEGAYIIRSPETGYYYLFMTFGGLDSTGGYNIRVGRSLNPDGPYLDAAGNDLTNVKGNFAFDDATIAPYGVKLMGNWQFLHVTGEPQTTSRGYVSPGGCSINRDPVSGRYVLVMHTRFVGQGEVHEVRVHQLFLNADGWFVAAPQRYAQETMCTTVAAQVPGDYKLINHGKDITATVKTSSVITLKSDGTITGAATGTWQLSGDHFAALTIGGVTYHGVFAEVWDDDNQVWVLAFTALSSDGVAVWGSRVAAPYTATAPTILMQPANQTATTRSRVTLTVGANGLPPPSYQWQKNGVAIAGATGNTYAFDAVAPADAGSYVVVLTNSAGTVTSASATLTVTPAAVPDAPAQAGGFASATTDVTLTWQPPAGGDMVTGYRIERATDPAFTTTLTSTDLATTSTSYDDTTVTAGVTYYYRIRATNALGVSNPSGTMKVTTPTSVGTGTAALVNISTRAYCSTGDNVTIGGFVMGGSGAKRVLIRAVGPSLAGQGVASSEVLADPTIEVHDALHGNVQIAANDNWTDNTNASEITNVAATIGAQALTSSDTKSAAMLLTLTPGVYTFVVRGSGSTSGIVLAEVYDADTASPAAKLVNIASRAFCAMGDRVAIGGYVVSGGGPKRLLIRAVGPTLATEGLAAGEVLADPTIEVHDALNGNVVIAANDNWSDNVNASDIVTTGARIGATPFASTDTTSSALLVTLPPGVYSFVAQGRNGTSGIVLVEVYDAD